jgi:hypothetical protein
MVLQKIIHVRQGLEETKARLSNLHNFRRHFEGVQKALITADGTAQFDCTMPNGFRAHFVLVELPTSDANQVFFRSSAGNMDLAGLIEFFEIRPGLTEVQLTLEYSIKSPVHSFVDSMTGSVERFVNRQLRRLQAVLDGCPLPLPQPKSKRQKSRLFTGHLPQLAH